AGDATGRGPAAPARALRALARSVDCAGARSPGLRAAGAGRRGLCHRRGRRRVSALQLRGRGGERARGDHSRATQLRPGRDGARPVGALHGAAGGEDGTRVLRVRRPSAPVRPPRREWPRAAGTTDPSRGLRQGGPAVSRAARLAMLVLALAVAVMVCGLGALSIGGAPVPPRAVIGVLRGDVAAAPVEQVVVLELRLPRILAALLAGGALAVAGVGFQGLTRNPLAEPSVLGVSSGAAFGVVLAQVFGLRAGLLDTLGLTAFAFAGAFVAGMVVYAIALRAGGLPVHTLVLAGVIVGIFFSSAITVLISIVDFDRLGGVIYW